MPSALNVFPSPTTAGEFLRHFLATNLTTLMQVINDKRLLVWQQQPDDFFEHAIIDVDGTLASTDAECKADMNLAYKGTWGPHPILVSLANPAEVLFLHNRPASPPSHEDAADYLDQAAALGPQRDHLPRGHGFQPDRTPRPLGQGQH